jgi:hypothetical protein
MSSQIINTIIIIIIIIIIDFLTSQPQLGNIHLSWDTQSTGLGSMVLFIVLNFSYNWTCSKHYRFLQFYVRIRMQVKTL